MTPSTPTGVQDVLRVTVTAGIGDIRFSDQSADLRGHHHWGRAGNPHPEPAGTIASKQPGGTAGGYIDEIDAPALFIQGTVDVLFPLDQALANAAGIGTRGRRQNDLVLRRSRRLPDHGPKTSWTTGRRPSCATTLSPS